jgi:glucose-6-phosphate 1-epimerase
MRDLAADLTARWGRPDAIMFEDRFGGTVAIMRSPEGCAVVALQGAQVLSWVPTVESESQGDVLWLSPVARLGTGKAVRGGIPICWPWFGAHPHDGAAPAHGFVRTALWTVQSAAVVDNDEVRLVLTIDAPGAEFSPWPHSATATLEITLGTSLTLALSTENTGAEPLVLSQALHSYFSVGDIARTLLTGLDGRRYLDQLEPLSRPVQHGPLEIAAEVDRIYQDSPDAVVISDETRSRRIEITKSGSLSTVVWNPWIEKSARLGDAGADGYRRFVCVETANTGDDAVTLAPGARHQLIAKLAVRQL